MPIEFDGPNSKVSADTIAGQGGSTITIQSGHSLSGSGASLTALNATQLTSGTVPDARFPSTLPAASGVNLTALNGSNIASGTVADARISALTASKLTGALPAISGASLTNLPAATSVAFPASQSASSNVNTLDDYEEGTWTPVLDAVGATNSVSYSSQSGHYVKIGKIVMCNFFIALSNKGSWSSPGVIKGFPFTFANVGYNKGGGAGGGWYGMSTSLYWLGLKGYPGYSYAYLRATSSAGTASGGLGSGDFGNSAELSLSFNYVASS